MRRKMIALCMAAMLATAAFTGCGGSDAGSQTPASTEEKTTPAATEPEETAAPTEAPTEAQTSAGEAVEENGLRKEPVYTNKELGISGTTGSISYSVSAIQVSKLTATTDEMAEMLEIEKDKEVTLVVIDVSAENTSEDTINFYIDQATLTSNTKEQVDPDMMLSDYIDAEFLGNVIHSGTLMYILPNSNASDVETVTLHIDAPHNENFDSTGDPVEIEIQTK